MSYPMLKISPIEYLAITNSKAPNNKAIIEHSSANYDHQRHKLFLSMENISIY